MTTTEDNIKLILDILNSIDNRLKKIEDYIYSQNKKENTKKENIEKDENTVIEKAKEIEDEILKMMKEKNYQYVYSSVIRKKCKEKGIDYQDFIRNVKQLYEKEKDKWYPI